MWKAEFHLYPEYFSDSSVDLDLVPPATDLPWPGLVSRTHLFLYGPGKKQGDLLQALGFQVIHSQDMISMAK